MSEYLDFCKTFLQFTEVRKNQVHDIPNYSQAVMISTFLGSKKLHLASKVLFINNYVNSGPSAMFTVLS